MILDQERPSIFYQLEFDCTIVVDTREQDPLFTPDEKNVIFRKLSAGDYSVLGLENLIAIERKSGDLFTSLGTDRKRFMSAVKRMLDLKWKGLLIEMPESRIYTPQSFSSISPSSIYGSLCSLEVRGFHIYYAPNRERARAWVISRLSRFYRYHREGKI